MGQKSILSSSIVVVGRVGAPYGIKGWAHIQSFTRPPNNILSFKTWYLFSAGQWQSVPHVEARVQGKGIVALLAGCQTPEDSAVLVNTEIGVLRIEFPALANDEYYWTDLIGLTVVTEQGVTLGKIDSLFETGSNDVLIVKGETKEYLIPYLPGEYVLEIDLVQGVMQVSWDPEF